MFLQLKCLSRICLQIVFIHLQILKYVTLKVSFCPQFFLNEVPNYVRYAIETKFIGMLNKKDDLGRTYFLVDTGENF